MKKIVLLLLGCLVLMPKTQILAQTAADPNEGSRLNYDSTNEIWRFKWWGRSGKSYFIQHSEDLMSWEYLPLMETGADDVLEWGFTSTGDRFFLRLKIYNDPFGTDSDGDGMSDAYEILHSLNPQVADGSLDLDGDGIANGEDARPNDPATGRLSVVITTPADSSILP